MHVSACREQEKILNHQEMELQLALSHPIWVLGMVLRSPARAVSTSSPYLKPTN